MEKKYITNTKLIASMKRLLITLFVPLAVMLAGCKETEESPASLMVDPESEMISFHPTTLNVTVSSSDDWTLDGTSSWITPSATKGSNGDVVSFDVTANGTGKLRAAQFTFKCKEVSETFTVRQTSGEIAANVGLSVVSADDKSVTLKVNVESGDLVFLKTWGVLYSDDADSVKTRGTDHVLDGAPVAGDTEVTLTGLDANKTYYFMAYVAVDSEARIYSENVAQAFTGSAFNSAVTVSSVTARNAALSFTLQLADVNSAGICWSTNGTPTVDDNKYEVASPATGTISTTIFDNETILKGGTKYYACAYIVRSNGETVYGPVSDFTTMADPFDNWLSDDNYKSDYMHFQSLCEFGPIKDGDWGSSQTVTESAGDTQTKFRNTWNTALTTYETTNHYAAMFSELMFSETGGSKIMQNLVWREGSVGEGLPKEANRVGGFSYTYTKTDEGVFSFTATGYAYVSSNAWAVRSQGLSVNEIETIYKTCTNQSDLESLRKFWTEHKFFADWGETKQFDGQDYREILFYTLDDMEVVFRFNPSVFGTSDYDFTAYPMSTEPDPPVEENHYLYINDGSSTELKVALEAVDGGYYLCHGESLAGKKIRISADSETGYPAYVPGSNGAAKKITSASGLYTVPSDNSWANKCAVSLASDASVCVVKDIFIYSETMSIVGDCIDLTGTTISSDWNAWAAFTYYKSQGTFFAPTDKIKEPHIYRFSTTFKTCTGEGFKIIVDGGWDNCYLAKVNGEDPTDTWRDVVWGSGYGDYKWKPTVTGDYVIELDANAMKLRSVKK